MYIIYVTFHDKEIKFISTTKCNITYNNAWEWDVLHVISDTYNDEKIWN